jgi:ketosteroid isomerase-like protein
MDFLSYFDDSYFGWSYDDEAPSTKADAQKSLGYWTAKGKVVYYIITPSKIWVNGNFAYVHYYYTQVTESTDGKPSTEKGRWTDILMKKGDKWMLVGDHGGEIKNDD